MVLLTWLKYILKLFTVRDKTTGQPRLIMGNAISSVTNLAGIHGNSVAIAIGVSLGVMFCVAAFLFYQNRQLQKKVNRLMLANPEAQFYPKPGKINPQYYRNLAYHQNQQPQNNNPALGNRRIPGGVADAWDSVIPLFTIKSSLINSWVSSTFPKNLQHSATGQKLRICPSISYAT